MIYEDMSSINKTNNKIIYDTFTDIEFKTRATKGDYNELNSSVMIDRFMVVSFVGDDKVAIIDLSYKSLYCYYCIGFMYKFEFGRELNTNYVDKIRSEFKTGNIQSIGDFWSLLSEDYISFYSHVGFDCKNKKFLDVLQVINKVESGNKAVQIVKTELSKSKLKGNKDYTITYGVFTDTYSEDVCINNTIKFISDNSLNGGVYEALCDVIKDCESRGQCSRLMRLKDKIQFSIYINGGSY